MIRLVILILLILSKCQSTGPLDTLQQENNTDTYQNLFDAFSDADCNNPCWLGIEVGVTTQEDVIAVLEERGIEYGVPGVIHLYSIPDGTVPGINPEGIYTIENYPVVLGDINVSQIEGDIVRSIDFFLDLCVQTIVNAYGAPDVWFKQDDIPSTVVYRDRQMFFRINIETRRVDYVILHSEEVFPPDEELENWAGYADVFSDECSDAFATYD